MKTLWKPQQRITNHPLKGSHLRKNYALRNLYKQIKLTKYLISGGFTPLTPSPPPPIKNLKIVLVKGLRRTIYFLTCSRKEKIYWSYIKTILQKYLVWGTLNSKNWFLDSLWLYLSVALERPNHTELIWPKLHQVCILIWTFEIIFNRF